MSPNNHIQSLLTCISQGLYEKEHILALALLSAISGESLFLLGPPGTAKSEVARRLKLVFRDASAFEYLMSRFSTPDEIFGPISIQKLKLEDTYERKVEGFLPSATVVFLDEIWKAGPAIQNALLTVINEKIYQNGTCLLHVPMKCLVAASNELPAEDEGLEALWDRFLLRVVSNCIEDEKTFYKMLRMPDLPPVSISEELLITEEIYASWRKQILQVEIPDHILFSISAMRKELTKLSKMEEINPLDYYISDRRWRKNIQLLRTSAFLNDRTAIDYTDLILLIHTLWNKVSCIEAVLKLVVSSLFADINKESEAIDAACEKEMKQKIEQPTDTDTKPFKLFNYFYLALQNHPKGKCFFYECDYKYIPEQGDCPGIMYFDDNMKGYVIRRFSSQAGAFGNAGRQNVSTVKLSRYNGALVVDGMPYQFVRNDSTPSPSPIISQELLAVNPLSERTHKALELLQERVADIRSSQNIFLAKDDIKLVNNHIKALEKRLNIILAKSKNL